MSMFYINLQLTPAITENKILKQDGQVTAGVQEVSSWVIAAEPKSDIRSITEPVPTVKPKLAPQVIAAILGSWISFAGGASIAFVTAALPLLQMPSSKVLVNEEEGSWIASVTMLGALVGGACSGPCVARGRRTTLWMCSVPLTLTWLLLANAQAVWMITLSHFAFGVCIGIGNDATQLYVSEVAHFNRRGALGCIPLLMFSIGTLACYFSALFSASWEVLAWVGACLTLPSLVLPAYIPESPNYLVSQSRESEATVALQRLRGASWDPGPELSELLQCKKAQLHIRARLMAALTEKSALVPLCLVAAIRLFSRLSGLRAIQTYTQDILSTSRSSLDHSVAVFITGAVQFISTLIACVAVERFGRRPLLTISQGVMSLSLLVLATYLILQPNAVEAEVHPTLGWLPVCCIALYLIANAMGLGPISGLCLGELVPQRHRSIATSITGSLSWCAAFVVTKSFNVLRNNLHLYGTLYLYAGVCICGSLFVLKFVPETMGKTSLQIDDLFNGPRQDDEPRNLSNDSRLARLGTLLKIKLFHKLWRNKTKEEDIT